MPSKVSLLLAVALTLAPRVASASTDPRFAAQVDRASAVFLGVGDGVTIEISEVLKGAPIGTLEAAGGQTGKLLVLVHTDVAVFPVDTPAYRYARAVVQILDPTLDMALDFEALGRLGRADLLWWYDQVFSHEGVADTWRLEFLRVVLERADPSWRGDLLPLLPAYRQGGAALALVQWFERFAIDAIPTTHPEDELQQLADPIAGPWLLRRLSWRRATGASLTDTMEALAACDPDLCACALGRLMQEDPWPHVGFQANEEVRADLAARLEVLDVLPGEDCRLQWPHERDPSIPDGAGEPRFIESLDLDERHHLLMHLALAAPYDENLVGRLLSLAEDEPSREAQDLALMTAVRIVARAPAGSEDTAAALAEHLRHRAAEGPMGTRDDTAAMVGVLAASRPVIGELLMAQYNTGDTPQQEWSMRVWCHTDFRTIEGMQRRLIVEQLLASNPQGEYRWMESATLSHIEASSGGVHGPVSAMMGSGDEMERARGVRWAAAAQVRPDEMLVTFLRLYRTDTPPVQAMALWGIASVIGGRESFGDAAPLLGEVVADLAHDHPELREQAGALLHTLISQECRYPGRHPGLEALQPILLEQLRTAEGEHRSRLVDFLRTQREECLDGPLRHDRDER